MKLLQTCRMLVASATLLVANSTLAAGLLTPVNHGYGELQIAEHHVNVVIDNGYATTAIEQVFSNPHQQDLEAIYSFPVPSKASVGEFTYWIDGVPVVGEVLEKQDARAIYKEEKASGRETALAEQDSFKTLELSVYPVKALDNVRIKLVYVQPTHEDGGIGRYQYPLQNGGVDDEKQAFWNGNHNVEGAFTFNLKLRSGYPVDGMRLPSHPQAHINQLSTEEWTVKMVNGEAISEGLQDPGSTVTKLNKDIVAYWRLAPDLPGSLDMVTQRKDPSGRGTFMMTLTPGDDLGLVEQGRDWVFVLDISGSMQGKYQTLVAGVRQGLKKLKPEDRFSIVLFNNTAHDLTHGYEHVTEKNVADALRRLKTTKANGGTNLYAGLGRSITRLDKDRPTAIILVTDGVANVGVTEKKAFLKLLDRADVRLFSFIMGNSANRPLLEGMTTVSNGFYQEVSNSDDIVGQLMLATEKLTHEAFRDITFAIKGVKVTDVTPQEIGSLYSGQQLHLFGHYWEGGEAKVQFKGKIGTKEHSYETTIKFPETSQQHPEIERLWAFATIEQLEDKQNYFGSDADTKQAIVDIAKEYSLVTEYTSMLVVRDEVFDRRGIQRNNRDRVTDEHQARQQRSAQPVQQNRVDTVRPISSSHRPRVGSSGGGALNPWMLLIMSSVLIPALARRHRDGSRQ